MHNTSDGSHVCFSCAPGTLHLHPTLHFQHHHWQHHTPSHPTFAEEVTNEVRLMMGFHHPNVLAALHYLGHTRLDLRAHNSSLSATQLEEMLRATRTAAAARMSARCGGVPPCCDVLEGFCWACGSVVFWAVWRSTQERAVWWCAVRLRCAVRFSFHVVGVVWCVVLVWCGVVYAWSTRTGARRDQTQPPQLPYASRREPPHLRFYPLSRDLKGPPTVRKPTSRGRAVGE